MAMMPRTGAWQRDRESKSIAVVHLLQQLLLLLLVVPHPPTSHKHSSRQHPREPQQLQSCSGMLSRPSPGNRQLN